MSHTGNGEHDFDDLKNLGLSPEAEERVRQARVEARTIIDSLEPMHITSWADLLAKLEEAVERAEANNHISEFLRVAKETGV